MIFHIENPRELTEKEEEIATLPWMGLPSMHAWPSPHVLWAVLSTILPRGTCLSSPVSLRGCIPVPAIGVSLDSSVPITNSHYYSLGLETVTPFIYSWRNFSLMGVSRGISCSWVNKRGNNCFAFLGVTLSRCSPKLLWPLWVTRSAWWTAWGWGGQEIKRTGSF